MCGSVSFLVVLITNYCVNVVTALSTGTETLTYQTVHDTTDQIKLNLGGSTYGEGKKCRLIRSNEAEILAAAPNTVTPAAYIDINSCAANSADESATGKCVVDCTADNNLIIYKKLSAKNKYIYVAVGTTVSNIVGDDQKKGGQVFGFATPLLGNPQVDIFEIKDHNKLKFGVKTFPSVNCPIYYKNMNYATGTKGGCSKYNTSDNKVDFDLMIPHYEVRCGNYPSFYYNMPNAYMKNNIEIYKPQYYVVTKADNKVIIKFTISLSSEICLFSLKSALTEDSKNPYLSICGDATKRCYAPCKDVVLTGVTGKRIYTILIQTRHHNIESTDANLEGYTQTKFAITKSDSILLPLHTSLGVPVNVKHFDPTDAPRFTTCTLKHYPADKPRPINLTDTKCKDSSSADKKCKTDCANLVIQELVAGKAYILEIEPANSMGASNFKEQLFIRTTKASNKEYLTTTETITDSTVTLTAVGGTPETAAIHNPTCEYYVSPAGKNSFFAAKCTHNNPCRGLCRDQVTIEDLQPNNVYDIRVVAHKDYELKDYTNIRTELTTLTITSKVVESGLILNAQLAANDPTALCSFVVKMMWGKNPINVFACPPNQKPKPSPTSAKSSTKSSSINSTSTNNSSHPASQYFRTSLSALKSDFKTKPNQTPTNVGPIKYPTLTDVRDAPYNCSTNPTCGSIRFYGYDASFPYKIIVSAMGKSLDKEFVLLPTAPKPNPTDETNLIHVHIKRNETSFIINNKLPKDTDENLKCKWELRNHFASSKAIIRSCMDPAVDGCSTFPTCKEFTILDVPDTISYHITVYSSRNDSVFGNSRIHHGEKYSHNPKEKLLIIAIEVFIVIIIAVSGVVILKRKSD